jgi:hypothetical protein
MSDQLSLPQSLALRLLAREPLFVHGIGGVGSNAGWAPKGDRRRGFQTQTITTLERHGLATINGGKASITARGKRFLEAEGK